MTTAPTITQQEVGDIVHDALVYQSLFYGTPITEEGLRVRSRDLASVRARSLVAHCLRESGMSLPQIGRVLDRDHTTVLSMLRRVREVFPAEELTEIASYVAECRDDREQVRRKAAVEKLAALRKGRTHV